MTNHTRRLGIVMDPIGTIEAVKTVAELFSPVSGEVVEVNEAIIEHPEIINRDPFEEGWFVKIKMSDPGELDNLFSVIELVSQEWQKGYDGVLVAAPLKLVLQEDGGHTEILQERLASRSVEPAALTLT